MLAIHVSGGYLLYFFCFFSISMVRLFVSCSLKLLISQGSALTISPKVVLVFRFPKNTNEIVFALKVN